MDSSQVVLLLAAVAVGAGLAFIIVRNGSKAAIDGAVATNGAELQARLASVTAELEQVRVASSDRASVIATERALVGQLRNELTQRDVLIAESRETVSRLQVDANRLAGTEGELKQERQRVTDALQQAGALREEIGKLQANLSKEGTALVEAAGSLRAERAPRDALAAERARLVTQVATLEQQLESERSTASEKLQLLDGAKATLADQFKLVATEIMDNNAKRFVEQSQTNLGGILDPLRDRIVEFQKKVEEVYVDEGKDRAALKDQVQRLVDLNSQLSEDAKNLPSALRGSNKSQGNWGELILQRILEDAGLREGTEFILQDAQTNDDGKRQQPDVVIQLPELRKIVVDAKVSLLAFERAMSATDEEVQRLATREHIASVRAHIKGLAARKYDQLYGVTLDFVVMFIPIEPAFMLAVTNDEKLCSDAWDKNVLLVSPSTLLFVLRTVAYLWRQEAQTKNAKEIASRGASLYDKLASFVSDLEAVGSKLDAAQQSFTDAHKKLASGRGSVIRQAEMLRALGIKPTKSLPKGLVDGTDEGEMLALADSTADFDGIDGVQTEVAELVENSEKAG